MVWAATTHVGVSGWRLAFRARHGLAGSGTLSYLGDFCPAQRPVGGSWHHLSMSVYPHGVFVFVRRRIGLQSCLWLLPSPTDPCEASLESGAGPRGSFMVLL